MQKVFLLILIFFVVGCTSLHVQRGDVDVSYISTRDIKGLRVEYNAITGEFFLEVFEVNASKAQAVLFDAATKAINPFAVKRN